MTQYYQVIEVTDNDTNITYWMGNSSNVHVLLLLLNTNCFIRPLGARRPKNIPQSDIKEF